MIGILIGLYLENSIALFVNLVIGLILIFCIILKKASLKILVLLVICIFGTIYCSFLKANYEKTYTYIEGTKSIQAVVISEPEDKEYKYRYTVKIESIDGDTTYKGIKLILDIKLSSAKYLPEFGDKIMITGEIEIPNTSRNYKGYDYQQYLKTKKIYGIIDASNVTKVEEDCLNIVSNFVNFVQKDMKETFTGILDEDEEGLCIGILIGDRSGISDEIEDDFKESNLTHMLAVSGSHITYIINAFAISIGKTNKRFSKVATIIFLIFFMILTDFTASVLRASFMGILVLIASLLYRKSDTINNLAISSLIILLINPYTIVDVGFLLSFAGTLGIVLFADRITEFALNVLEKVTPKAIDIRNIKTINYIITSLSITLSANILIIPIMAYSFSTFSFTFWISNILAGPVMEIVTIFGFMIYFISIFISSFASFLGIFLNLLLGLLLKIAQISSIIPGSSVYIKTPTIWHIALYYAIVILITYKSQIKKKLSNNILIAKCKKIIASVLIIIFILNKLILNIIPTNLKIYFIDVGQGDSTLIQTPYGKNILIDGGGSEFSSYDVGENTLLPYLLDRRIKKLDYVIISHFDTDHVQGILYIMQYLKIENIIISKQGESSSNLVEFQNILEEKNINIILVKQGDNISIDKVSYIEILFPEEDLIQDNILNNNSIVCKFVSNNISMLFTGDIEEEAEEKLCKTYGETNKLQSDILKVAHHGSKTSSTEKFLKLVSPKIALIGVGANNTYGHPNDDVIMRLKEYTNIILRTDECGEIVLEFNKNKIKIDKHITV